MIQKDWITWSQLGAALLRQSADRRPVGEILVSSNFISRKHVLRALGYQLGIDFVDLKQIRVDRDAIRTVPKHYACGHKILPFERRKDSLKIATASPFNYWVKALLSQATGISEIRSVLAAPEDIDDALARYYGMERDVA